MNAPTDEQLREHRQTAPPQGDEEAVETAVSILRGRQLCRLPDADHLWVVSRSDLRDILLAASASGEAKGREEERERCAKVAEWAYSSSGTQGYQYACERITAAIREVKP